MTPRRIESFSDGVLAIAATLLILDVRVPAGALGEGLLHAWPSYAAYAVSFLTIGIIWINHHTMIDLIGRVDRAFLLLNVFLLMLVAFVPFPTHLVAEHLLDEGARAAALAYGSTLTMLAVFFNAVWLYAVHGRRLLRGDADPRLVSGITRSYRTGPVTYLIATLVALVSPVASVVMYALIALFFVLESSLFGRRD